MSAPVRLRAKGTYRDEDVQRVWEGIEAIVSRDEAESAIADAAQETIRTLDRLRIEPARAAYGWSGGKDSLALGAVMEAAGIRQGVCGTITALEFPVMRDWLREYVPEGVALIPNPGIDIPWLDRHPEVLFPTTHGATYVWATYGSRWAQTIYAREHDIDLMIYGRRTLDGNRCGDGRGIAPGKGGHLTYAPIRRWPHELVLAVVRYWWVDSGRPMCPLYATVNGWREGTARWPGRSYASWDEGFATTHGIDPSIIPAAAAAGLRSAAEWLERSPS